MKQRNQKNKIDEVIGEKQTVKMKTGVIKIKHQI